MLGGHTVKGDELIELLKDAPESLLMFGYGNFLDRADVALKNAHAAIQATEGRILLCHATLGLVDVEALPEECLLAAMESRRLIDEADNYRNDPSIFNEWESLYNRE